jgi:hypothetical protein
MQSFILINSIENDIAVVIAKKQRGKDKSIGICSIFIFARRDREEDGPAYCTVIIS